MNPGKKDKSFAVAMGDVSIRKSGRRVYLRDFYHMVLKLGWPGFYTLIVVFFVAINLLFAIAYACVDHSVANARPDSFADLFFFSIETLATVGYGVMSPGNLYGHIVASIEILAGMMSIAVVTGLIFARFSKPTARILFADKMVIRDFDGGRMLMLRVANERHNLIMEASATLSLVREEMHDGERLFRIHDLALVRDHSVSFALTWTLMHRIDENSPLHGWDRARLLAGNSRITLSLTGHDETIASSVHALHTYNADALRFDHRFVDIIHSGPTGETIVDLTRFHDVMATE